jgi:hypothetical protein
MKKSSFLVLLLLVTSFLVQAQKGIGLGIKAGANFADQSVEDIDVNSATDFHAGVYVNINFSEKFGITPEVLYTAYGTKWDDVKVDYDYIAIPVMVRFLPAKFVSIEAGPQFSFLTKAEVEDVGDVKDQLKSNDFGLAFGAGLHLPLGLQVGARYVLGFTDISDVSESSVKNRTFQVYAGWTIFGAR